MCIIDSVSRVFLRSPPSMVLCYGKTLGQFTHPPPPDIAGLCEAVTPSSDHETLLKLRPFVSLGTSGNLAVSGPEVLASHEGFAPAPIDTGGLSLPLPLHGIRDQLAHQLHDVWAKNKIEAGYIFAEVRRERNCMLQNIH